VIAILAQDSEPKKQQDRTERRNPVKDQVRGKKDRARFFSGHAAETRNVHEQVTSDNRSIGKTGKEATG
jgi:hypothetical protein